MENVQERLIPVHLLSGFLGSGKTTLLNRLMDYYKAADVKVAVVMNELGEVNLDGQFVDQSVPMAEMLSGCICCSISGDLSMELKSLIDEHQPDVILIEATGAANPMEIMDAVTETAMFAHIDLRSVITVVDGPELISRSRRGGKTFRLMKDQIRCATDLIVNKADKLAPEELVEVQQLVRELNSYAPLEATVRCVTDLSRFDRDAKPAGVKPQAAKSGDEEQSLPDGAHVHDESCGHAHGQCGHGGHGHSHASHDHVMTWTHYLDKPVNSHSFEAFMKGLPDNVYRAKGIVTFEETGSRYMFQYAYRELECTRITPQAPVNDVAVFIGEHFRKDELLSAIHAQW
ncbi:G3E family GTPase [Paenibacillus phyllosphaerae]|uniref:G3E family GTPase n=1 Tax=Paenibacillus phyllosphaerae TaxID=274593 RepID=A0A7W5B0N2_9BACL|nr:CobW family GTP-binding protein [Paenibacillus phyllosphaerae]MBB3112097.1 G3E family GTPase [Paenibacillus phyllosphaerae]